MRRRISSALAAVLLALLLLSVLVEVWAVPAAVRTTAQIFPEVEPIAIPSIIWAAIAIACWQAVGVIALRITVLARDHSFDASAYGLLRAMIGCLLAYVLLAVFAFIALNALGWATAGVVVGLFCSGLLALIAAGSLALFLGTRPLARYYLQH